MRTIASNFVRSVTLYQKSLKKIAPKSPKGDFIRAPFRGLGATNKDGRIVIL
jgi:hypothetical protein